MNVLKRKAWLLAAAVLLCPPSVHAQGCPEAPPSDLRLFDRTLVVMTLDRATGSWNPATVDGTAPALVNFSNDPLCFYYGVSDPGVRSGALVIKVIRAFTRPIGPLSENVFLHRNDGFFNEAGSTLDVYGGSVTRAYYAQFHRERRPDPDFRRRFHAYWTRNDANSGSAQPAARLGAFDYPSSIDRDSTALTRTYLLRYSTSAQGSWIPFNVGTASLPQFLQQVSLTIWDLGVSSQEPVFGGSVTRGEAR